MSIINKMLQDLDRRQGRSEPDATLAMSQVRTVPSARKDREWFWRIIAVLMIAAVGWVGWIAWQLQPRQPIVTEQAFKAAESAQKKAVAAAPVLAPTPIPAAAPLAPAVQAESKRADEKPAAEALKLTQDIGTPIREQSPKPAAGAASKATPKVVAPQEKAPPAPVSPSAPMVEANASTPAHPAAKVEKRDRTRTPEERAEGEFRRAAGLLNQGRISEAEESLDGALRIYPGHEGARQALIALDLEQGRVDSARRLLQEGLALNPANARFAAVLARILIERKDYAAALDAIAGAQAQAQGDADLQRMRGMALQRLGRHAEASEAFRASLRADPQNGATWMALGISLEAQDKRRDASDAYRRAAAAGTLGPEARDYAQQRARALQ